MRLSALSFFGYVSASLGADVGFWCWARRRRRCRGCSFDISLGRSSNLTNIQTHTINTRHFFYQPTPKMNKLTAVLSISHVSLQSIQRPMIAFAASRRRVVSSFTLPSYAIANGDGDVSHRGRVQRTIDGRVVQVRCFSVGKARDKRKVGCIGLGPSKEDDKVVYFHISPR